MAGKEPEYGQTAETVAANITRLRTAQNLTYTDVSERVKSAGWSLTPVAVRRIENKQRKVSPDDLTSLAVALRVSPTTLLMPPHRTAGDDVEFTGGRAPAMHVWEWLRAESPYPLHRGSEDVNVSIARFQADNWPGWFLETERLLEEGRRARHIRAAFAWAEDEQAAGERAATDGDD
ncbi:helix-turn-helix domain-containing protein [Nocardia jinanensis]|uniref:HTH cro/C1-type domain-containing protein n=1 Tax=Nocardia jinanensis TaxID=382504 RepID=A0A917RJ95_9NOCA|nr:helix-turn-helix transcriptional regulator [Nocardia jinanensis]GGL09732.1 hypothetical protein GCM10011588_25170 [Nocardia jinanensis]